MDPSKLPEFGKPPKPPTIPRSLFPSALVDIRLQMSQTFGDLKSQHKENFLLFHGVDLPFSYLVRIIFLGSMASFAMSLQTLFVFRKIPLVFYLVICYLFLNMLYFFFYYLSFRFQIFTDTTTLIPIFFIISDLVIFEFSNFDLFMNFICSGILLSMTAVITYPGLFFCFLFFFCHFFFFFCSFLFVFFFCNLHLWF